MTEDQLAEIEARVKAATEGPWHCDGELVRLHDDGDEWDVLSRKDFQISQIGLNAKFIAHARTDVPDLIAEVRRLNTRIARLQDPDYGSM